MSEIRNWDVTHLENAAEYWRSLADQCDHAFNSAYQGSLSPGGTVWEGPAAEAAEARSLADMRVVSSLSDALRAAAQIADTGAGDLRNAQQGVLLEVRDAEAAGLVVGENLSIGESNPFSAEARSPGRGAVREEFANEIHIRAAALSALDHEVARGITNATMPLDNVKFSESPATDIVPTDTPSPSLPPPLPPPLNDEPWKHGGDRRATSVALEGIKQKLVAAAEVEMWRNDQSHAANLLEHYLSNTGTPVALSPDVVDAWLSDSATRYADTSPPATVINGNLQQLTDNALAEARRTGRSVSVSGNTPWKVVAGSDGDSVRSLGHYSLSTAYSITMTPDGSYSATYRNDVSDWYNFATTSPMPWDVFKMVSNAAHDLQAVGIAQDFLVTGSSSIRSVTGQVN